MKFSIHYVLAGPAGEVRCPNAPNPIEAENIKEVLKQLSEQLPSDGSNLGLQTVYIEVAQIR